MSESAAPRECPDRLADGAAWRQADAGAADAWRRDGLARGRLHELFAAEPGDAGAAAGMALALAAAAGALPLLWLRVGAAERETGRPSGAGAAELGIDPAALLLAVVPDEAALLRAAAEAGRCAGLGTLLVEAWGRRRGSTSPPRGG